MNRRELAALDDHISGGHYHKSNVHLRCAGGGTCDWSGEGIAWSEFGIGGTEPEECPDCGDGVEVDD